MYIIIFSRIITTCTDDYFKYLYFFQDLLNFDDPLNRDAAELFIKDRESFRSKVKDYVMQYAKR